MNFISSISKMRAGKPRAEALRNLVDRTGVDDIRSLVALSFKPSLRTSIAQACAFIPIPLRTSRRQRAEGAAAKTTIKMSLPS